MQLKDKVKVNLSASKSNELNSELTFRGKLKRDKWLLLLALPGTLYYIIFRYLPMFGIIIAFEDFDFRKGIFGSEFVFLDNIILFVKNPSFINILKNTILLGLINVIVTLPFAILFALLLNELINI